MKVGFSYSRCMRDLIDGKVDYDDVLVIIARTRFDPTLPGHWESIWRGYTQYNTWSNVEWEGYEDREEEFKALTLKLYLDGKLHQPRQFGYHPARTYDIWKDVV